MRKHAAICTANDEMTMIIEVKSGNRIVTKFTKSRGDNQTSLGQCNKNKAEKPKRLQETHKYTLVNLS